MIYIFKYNDIIIISYPEVHHLTFQGCKGRKRHDHKPNRLDRQESPWMQTLRFI